MILYLKSHKIDSIDTIFIATILNGIRQFLNIKIAFWEQEAFFPTTVVHKT